MNESVAIPANEKLSAFEKIGYSLGDLAANLIFQTFVTFIAFFYTDVYQIPADQAAWIIGICGTTAAFFSPVMGIIADRTLTKWGRYRPWVLWTSLPFGLLTVITFTTPDLDPQGKFLYAFVTYMALVLIFTANNLPYSALSGVITGSMSERNSLSSYRFVAVMVAQFIIQVLLLPLVLVLGNGDKATGFENTMIIFAVIGTIFFIITFLTTKERVVTSSEKKSSIIQDIGQDITDIIKNKPWIIMLFVTILVFITLALKGGMYIYYFQNYVDESHLAQFQNDIGFNGLIRGLNTLLISVGLTEFQWPKDTAISGNSIFNASGIIFMLVGIAFSKSLADKFGKRDIFISALFVSTIFIMLFYFFPPESVSLMFGSQVLHGFFYGITIPILWAMVADVADYSEWKNNRRATALIFSGILFGLKQGLAFGSMAVAAILANYGYDASLDIQNPETIEGIKFAVSIYATIPFVAACILLLFYEINKDLEEKIEIDLKQRRVEN
jgi:GPH family glycoside/pentoside/hexuronide:cation symporter